MTDRNREDLNRNQSGSSNEHQNERPEHRSTKEGETDRMGGPVGDEKTGVGHSDQNRNSNLGNEREGAGNRSTGNIEGDENLNRR